MANKGCGTCRDRKILCDRSLPGCIQCKRSKRRCAGYGLRLSWPGPGNKRRAIVGRRPPRLDPSSRRRLADGHWIHVTNWDVEMHHHIENLADSAADKDTAMVAPPTLELMMPFVPYKVQDGEGELLAYFRCNASRSLTIFGNDPRSMGSLLMRMAFAGPSGSGSDSGFGSGNGSNHSSRAVTKSLLALTSLHRYGLCEHAIKSKIATLRALYDASHESSISRAEAMQHVAAGMMLCSFEIHQSSCTSDQWTWYICGIKGVIRRSLAGGGTSEDPDVAALLDWVYYHDVMARFSMSHCIDKVPGGTDASAWLSLRRVYAEISHSTPPNFAILELLSAVCDVNMLGPPDSASAADHANYLKVLEWRIRNVPISDSASSSSYPSPPSPSSPDTNNITTMSSSSSPVLIQQLYKISTLIYFHRTAAAKYLPQSHHSHNRPDAAAAEKAADRGFAILSRLSSCERQFPLFVLGCEAHTDERRALVLDIMAGTEGSDASRSFNYLRLLLHAIWAQGDLAAGSTRTIGKLQSTQLAHAFTQ
ncbi:hypothetical protein N3K66_007944 [Trichothecium roseum]|uniref:Uncharacterized protein n=1 Tax=Trichothecium roseum TaxID=47278 RepID=A0ACC0UTT0_9HYPO|nr:hypothetical protein N3K66_007944 [Trichothecium roseum]